MNTPGSFPVGRTRETQYQLSDGFSNAGSECSPSCLSKASKLMYILKAFTLNKSSEILQQMDEVNMRYLHISRHTITQLIGKGKLNGYRKYWRSLIFD